MKTGGNKKNLLTSSGGVWKDAPGVSTGSLAGFRQRQQLSNKIKMATPFCEQYLGGYDSVVNKLAAALKGAREERGLDNGQFDEICQFNRRVSKRLPICTSGEYETTPSKLNSLIFSLAAVSLDLKTDKILKENILERDLTDNEREALGSYMRENSLGVQFSTGNNRNETVTFAKQAEVFLACKMFDEIDAVAKLTSVNSHSLQK